MTAFPGLSNAFGSLVCSEATRGDLFADWLGDLGSSLEACQSRWRTQATLFLCIALFCLAVRAHSVAVIYSFYLSVVRKLNGGAGRPMLLVTPNSPLPNDLNMEDVDHLPTSIKLA